MCGGGVYKFTRGICDMEGKNVIRRFISGEEQIYMHRRSTYLLYDMIDFWITVTNQFP